MEERCEGLFGLWRGEVGPRWRTIVDRGRELSTPAAPVVGLGLPSHSLTETHPTGEDERGEGSDEGANLVAVGEEHAEHKGTKHRPSHDPKDTEGSLEDTREVLDHEDDAVADDAEANGKELGDQGGLGLRQLDITARLDEIPENRIFKIVKNLISWVMNRCVPPEGDGSQGVEPA